LPILYAALFRVAAAFFAALLLDAALRLFAADRACRANALRRAADRGIFFNAPSVACERRSDVFLPARRDALIAAFRVFALVLPFFGGFSFTPDLRALFSPIAIACFVFAAPCLPSRMWCISSRTNSPACVEADLPSRLSSAARLSVSFSGIKQRMRLSNHWDV